MNQTQLELPGFSANSDPNATGSAARSSSQKSGGSWLGSKLASVWRVVRSWVQLVSVIVSVLSALYITTVTTTSENKTVEQLKAEQALEREQLTDHAGRIGGVEADVKRLWADVHQILADLSQIKSDTAAGKASLDEVKGNVRILVERAMDK